MVFLGLKKRELNKKRQRTLDQCQPYICGLNVTDNWNQHPSTGSSAHKRRRRESLTEAWFKGVRVTWWSALWQEGKSARSASLWNVLIDSGAAAGPRWVIGWFFFSSPVSAGTDQGPGREMVTLWPSWISAGYVIAKVARADVAVDPPALARKSKSLSWIFIGANKSETWVYLSACCQTVKKIWVTPSWQRNQTWFVISGGFCCLGEALDCKHKWIWQFFRGCQAAVK